MTIFNNIEIHNTLPTFLKSDLKGESSMVNARQVYEWLEVTEDFATWINTHIAQGNLVDDFTSNNTDGKQDESSSLEYLITCDAAQDIAICDTGRKGHYYRKYLIDCHNQVRTSLEEMYNKIGIPHSERMDTSCPLAKARAAESISTTDMGEKHKPHLHLVTCPTKDEIEAKTTKVGQAIQELKDVLMADIEPWDEDNSARAEAIALQININKAMAEIEADTALLKATTVVTSNN